MSGDLHELSAAIGALQANVSNLTKAVDDERESSAQHNKDLTTVVGALSASVRVLATEVESMKPLVIEYRDQREQARGAAMYRKWLLGSIAAAGGLIVGWLFQLANIIGFGKTHP